MSLICWTQRKIFWRTFVARPFWGTIDFHSRKNRSQWCPRTALFPTFFRIPSFVFSRTKTFIQVWNYLRVSQWWQNFHFWVNYLFKTGWMYIVLTFNCFVANQYVKQHLFSPRPWIIFLVSKTCFENFQNCFPLCWEADLVYNHNYLVITAQSWRFVCTDDCYQMCYCIQTDTDYAII